MSMMISQEQLSNMKEGENLKGVVLCREYNILYTKNGKEYISGSVSSGTSKVSFKAWGNSNAFQSLKTEEYSGVAMYINGTVDSYNGTVSLVLSEVCAVNDVKVDDLLPIRYNRDAYWNGLKALVYGAISDKAKTIANIALFENEDVAEAFKNEFAASSMHDNCKSGLMAHTYKMLTFAVSLTNIYTSIFTSQDVKDIFIVGCLLHDIGKIKEIHTGVYQHCAIVTHRYLGIEMLPKKEIIDAYGENGWLEFVAIMLQHHGAFDDKCRSVLSYLAFMCDNMDAKVTFVQQSMEQPQKNSSDMYVKVDDYKLVLPCVGSNKE